MSWRVFCWHVLPRVLCLNVWLAVAVFVWFRAVAPWSGVGLPESLLVGSLMGAAWQCLK